MEENPAVFNCYVSIRYGGLGNVFVSMSNHLFDNGKNIYVVLHYLGGELQEKVNENIKCYSLGYRGKFSYPRMLMNFIRLVKEKSPRVVISHSWNMNVLTILAKLFTNNRYKIIIFEHTSPQAYSVHHRLLGRIKQFSMKYLYRKADVLITVSEGIRSSFISQYNLNPQKVIVIPPPHDLEKIRELAKNSCDEIASIKQSPVIISVGILNSVKNFPLLLSAFAEVVSKVECRLVIVGDGEEKERIEEQARSLGVLDKLMLVGYQENPYRFISKSSIYVCTSKHEGFGLSILEALALGVPVIATETDGANQILDKGKYGILVQHNSEVIAKALFDLLSNKTLSSRLSTTGSIWADNFHMSISLRKISDVVDTMLAETRQH